LPATTRGGRLRIGSSPLGAGGMFWEIYDEQIRPYPDFKRSMVPWWLVAGLCRDVDGARQMAAYMTTEERVRTFGSPRLVQIFENMPLEDFQQEYECAWVDESVAWISWDEIKRNQLEAQAGKLWFRQANGVDDALAAIEETALAVQEGKVESALAGGMDIGRKRNLSELGFVGKSTTEARPLRLAISLANVEFDDQEAVVKKAVDALPVTKLLIDRNGIGMQLAENMEKATGKAEGVDFTNATKELWAVELKVRMQRGQVPIPLVRDLSYHIHSIKKKYTAAKNAVFDTQANEKHHADKFWMLALAVWASSQTSGAAAATADPEESEERARRRKSSWR
jgi:phage FluMu gp28-like protein